MNHMLKDSMLFLITFTIVMVAFASGTSYIFNMASGTHCDTNLSQRIRGGYELTFTGVLSDILQIKKLSQSILV